MHQSWREWSNHDLCMQTSIVLIAHNIRSLWNVGSIFRSADVFGISHVYLTGYTASPPREEISKTALGAETWISWSKEHDPFVVIDRLRSEGFSIVSLEKTENSTDLWSFVVPRKLCLLLGHEVLGVSPALLTASDHVVHIPMFGQKSSLNVSVATGIALAALRSGCLSSIDSVQS